MDPVVFSFMTVAGMALSGLLMALFFHFYDRKRKSK